jgi:hypothetical protein
MPLQDEPYMPSHRSFSRYVYCPISNEASEKLTSPSRWQSTALRSSSSRSSSPKQETKSSPFIEKPTNPYPLRIKCISKTPLYHIMDKNNTVYLPTQVGFRRDSLILSHLISSHLIFRIIFTCSAHLFYSCSLLRATTMGILGKTFFCHLTLLISLVIGTPISVQRPLAFWLF